MTGVARHLARPEGGGPEPRPSRNLSRVRGVVAALVFLVGAGVFLFPTISGLLAQRDADEAINQALSSRIDGAVTEPDAGQPADADPKEGSTAYEFLRSYNERVRTGEEGSINDPWGLGSDKNALAEAGIEDGLIGEITVPSMGVRLPLYLGATRENLARGAAVVSGTSAPLGESDSNCVVAAHRSLQYGLTMFRDIENVAVGDVLQITTPWDMLTYRAVGSAVIGPDDADAVRVQPGRDVVTLLTCHPYGLTTQRMVVYFERDDGAPVQEMTPLEALAKPVTDALEPSDSPQLVAERWLRVAGLALMAAVAAGAIVGAIRKRSGRKG